MIPAKEHFYRALLAYGENEVAHARAELEPAVKLEPDHLLYHEAVRYLDHIQRDGKQNIYATGDAFAAFVHGGGNISLYNATSDARRNI